MSLPTTNANGQSSIRNFFQPKPPSYAPPPAMSRTQAAPPAPPPPPLPPVATSADRPSIISQNGPSPPASAAPSRPSSLHPQATISPILPEHIPALRRITSLLLPVNYPDSFYEKIQDPVSSGAFSRVLLWTDSSPNRDAAPKVIGGLVCRPESSPFDLPPYNSNNGSRLPGVRPNVLYIQSLVLLSPYRQLGLAAALLDEVVQLAAESPLACREVYAHVWTDNEDGLRWYVARGFAKHADVKGYYYKLRPDSAWIVRRKISTAATNSVTAALGFGGNNNTTKTQNWSKPTIPPELAEEVTEFLDWKRGLAMPPAKHSRPPPRNTGPSPNRTPGPGTSFQNARPETEWNDLPADMHSTSGSGGSSRSSSVAPRKKKDRAYPAAAFSK
ncbi:hypothetical protein F4677DRAFT_357347 [Hypoxylon crocopeplum]|nr:hypothetical protein F4677DRAFT_357347 [Hypoxylon crocopeplum]